MDYSHAVCLAQRFRLDIDQEELKDEWTDFQLMIDEQLPSLQQDKLSTDAFWGTLLNMSTSLNVPRFLLMKKLFSVVLCLPHSNADSERVFSQVCRINIEYMKRMGYETLTALLQVKITVMNVISSSLPLKTCFVQPKKQQKPTINSIHID